MTSLIADFEPCGHIPLLRTEGTFARITWAITANGNTANSTCVTWCTSIRRES